MPVDDRNFESGSRRRFLLRAAALLPAGLLASRSAPSAELALLAEDDPAAKALKYVADAKRAKDAGRGEICANCALYQAPSGAAQGPCLLFKDKAVKASGWCTSWAAQM